jgi:AbrB family looped-hinge helix DNA binding protein
MSDNQAGDEAMGEAARVGKRGTVVIPAKIRRRFGIEEGSSVLVEEGPDGVLIRPAVTVPIDVWNAERKAGFLLENATSRKEYLWARREARRLGFDPDRIPHTPIK